MGQLTALLWLFLRYGQRLLVYPHAFFGRQIGVCTPPVPYKDIELITKDKVKLPCYLIHHSALTELRGTVILFHGNCMNHGDIVYPHAFNLSLQGFNVLTAEYRGYGNSEGIPSESGLKLDAQAAFDFVDNEPELSQYPIIICGHSLGGAVAIDVASRNTDKITALIVENTFMSIPHLVRTWPMGRFLSLLTTEKWWSASKVARMPPSLPILMLSGLRDTVIPSSEMAGLWEVAQTRKPANDKWFTSFLWTNKAENLPRPEKDVFKIFANRGHNDTYMSAGYWRTVYKFLDDVIPPPSST